MRELLAIPSYPLLWLSGFCWNLTRWMSIFLGSYLVNDLTGSPLLVQFVGAAFFAPMFFGGAFAGAMSDRFDRRRTILRQLGLLVLVSALMTVVVLAGAARAWMVYVFVLAVGVGAVVDITSRRVLIHDVVGDDHLPRALSFEFFGSSLANAMGAGVGGSMIALLGIGEAFALIALLYVAAFASLTLARTPPQDSSPAASSVRDEVVAGLRYVRTDPALISILGVTVLMNLSFFSFLPIVPVVAEDLGVGAALAGLLGSGLGIGMMAGALVLTRGLSFPAGRIYVGGSVIALCFLAGFALSPMYWLALASIVVAGSGAAGFGTMQSALVMSASAPAVRGRALGIVGMAIGVLPFGTILVGLLAEAVGAGAGVAGAVVVGLLLFAAWMVRRPESWKLP